MFVFWGRGVINWIWGQNFKHIYIYIYMMAISMAIAFMLFKVMLFNHFRLFSNYQGCESSALKLISGDFLGFLNTQNVPFLVFSGHFVCVISTISAIFFEFPLTPLNYKFVLPLCCLTILFVNPIIQILCYQTSEDMLSQINVCNYNELQHLFAVLFYLK